MSRIVHSGEGRVRSGSIGKLARKIKRASQRASGDFGMLTVASETLLIPPQVEKDMALRYEEHLMEQLAMASVDVSDNQVFDVTWIKKHMYSGRLKLFFNSFGVCLASAHGDKILGFHGFPFIKSFLHASRETEGASGGYVLHYQGQDLPFYFDFGNHERAQAFGQYCKELSEAFYDEKLIDPGVLQVPRDILEDEDFNFG